MDSEGVAQGDTDPVRDDLGWLSLATDEDRELVAADACQRVPFADAPAEALAHRAQQLVAARVAEPVVDLFEIVEVDEDQHERADGDRLIEPLGEEQPVGQLRQRVVVYLMCESVLHVVQALGQLPLRTDGDHLSNRDQHHQHNRAGELNAVEPLSDVEVEAVQHRHSEEPDVGQRELHPFDGVASAPGSRLPRQVEHRVGDQELAENESDASPELAVPPSRRSAGR